eukprot:COSAG02_NODE_51950_length_311_cov_0.523585_1_plen_34_part_10
MVHDEEHGEKDKQTSCAHDVLQNRQCTVAMGTNC